MSETRQKIINVMAVLFTIDPTEIPPNAAPGVIERWDSLGHMNLVMALEEEFGIRFHDDQLESLISIDLIELCVKELVA
jgi:acyl carrier protein